MTAARAHELLLPPPQPLWWPGAPLALLAHLALLAALTLGVQWRAQAPEAVTAELWAAVPQVAAPPEPAPATPSRPAPPPPAEAPPAAPLPDAQIAIEKAQQAAERQARARAEQDRAERERKTLEDKRQKDLEAAKKREQQQLAEARARKADEERLDRQRQANLDRLMGQVGNAGGTAGGSAARDAGPSAAYAGRLVATIKPNIVFTDVVSGNPAAEVEVRAAPSGTILARRLVRSSGDKDWDEAVLRAIDRTGSLPRDTDGRVPPTIVIAFRPRE